MIHVTSSTSLAVSLMATLSRKHVSHPHYSYRTLANITTHFNSNGTQKKSKNVVSPFTPPVSAASSLTQITIPLRSSASSHNAAASISLLKSSRRGCRDGYVATLSKHNITQSMNSYRMFSTKHGSLFQQSCRTGRPLTQVETPKVSSHIGEVPPEHRAFKGLESSFPCLSRVRDSGPEPEYDNITKGYKLYTHKQPFPLQLNDGVLPQLEVAYETWGELNEDASNAVLVLAGLSASSHARSSADNMKPGWWEKFIGPGCAVDSSKFFVICPNNLGSCYGTSGPSSINIVTGKQYATTFPIIGVEDMANAIFVLLDHLGINKLYAAVGSSLGGMLSLQSTVTYPDRVGRLVSISACAQSHPSSIAMRYLQRKCIMCDPNWNNGHYYGKVYPKVGMKLAREIATITYRSGPEWNERFGRNRISDDPPSLCPTFLIESYLEHQGESFSTKYDPNSLLYISKAMDMFDIGEGYDSLEDGLSRVKCPAMVIGVQTDMLFPIWQQREISKLLQEAGNEQVTFYELNSIYGHDTFLLDLNGVGAAVKGFLETEQRQTGWLTKHSKERKVNQKHRSSSSTSPRVEEQTV
uniref:AB hydrolase-1 domain-containing protein n=1 Tax=Arion vulgaris TaxID=1028688 RepID=A0A0B7A6S9_9EUPU